MSKRKPLGGWICSAHGRMAARTPPLLEFPSRSVGILPTSRKVGILPTFAHEMRKRRPANGWPCSAHGPWRDACFPLKKGPSACRPTHEENTHIERSLAALPKKRRFSRVPRKICDLLKDFRQADPAAIRKAMGFSQTEFARLLAVSVRTLHKWEQHAGRPSGAAESLLNSTLSFQLPTT